METWRIVARAEAGLAAYSAILQIAHVSSEELNAIDNNISRLQLMFSCVGCRCE